jgi:hypothetical protein
MTLYILYMGTRLRKPTKIVVFELMPTTVMATEKPTMGS